MTFSPLNDILNKKKTELGRTADASQEAFAVFRDIANKVLPEHLRDAYQIMHISNGVLYLEITHSLFAQEITVHKHTILRKIAMTRSSVVISDIRIQQAR